MRAWWLIAGAEVRLLTRSIPAIVLAVVLPTALGALIVWAEADTGRAGFGTAAGLVVVTLIVFTAYVAGTTTLTARRQEFVLERLRLSPASDAAIIAGVLTPTAVLTVVQAAVLTAIVAGAGGSAPVAVLPPVLALVGGTVLGSVLAIGTAAFTTAPEHAQLTTTPVVAALFAGTFWAASDPGGLWKLAVPGVPIVQLARAGWEGGPVLTATAALVLAIALAASVAVRVFRWR